MLPAKRLLLSLTLMFSAAAAWADPVEERVRARMQALQPDLKIEQVQPAAKQGLYQVQLRGGQFLYTDAEVEFIFHGQLYQVQGDQAVNLTERAQQTVYAEMLTALNDDEFIVFPAAEKHATITVFTDTDCGYCQKMHAEVAELNRQGIEVRYLAYPRQGLAGLTYDTMVSVWCADDPLTAMTQAKNRQVVERKTCKHPIEKHYALGQMMGVQGTPTIFLANGEVLPGYLPASLLVKRALQAQE